MNAKEVLEKITDDDIIQIMESLGSDKHRCINDGILFRTICHNGENEGKLKLHYHSESKTFYCYTECGNLSNIFNLIMHIRDCKFYEAYIYVCEILGISNSYQSLTAGFKQLSDNSFINKFNRKEEEVYEELRVLDESIINRFHNLYHQSWIDDHISIEVMKEFNIKFDILEGCIVIPHYDIKGDLIGIRGRYLDERKVEEGKKYMPLYIDGILCSYPTALNLFGININANNIIKYKRVIIGEAEKFVLQHKTFYPETSTAVALNGSSLSDYHIQLLKWLGVETIVLALDKEYTNNEEANSYSIKLKNAFIDRLKLYFNIEILWDTEDLIEYKDSPADKGKEVFDKLYENRFVI